jgi:hypothetical protein
MSTETDKVNTGALATLLAAGAFAVIAIAASVTALVRQDVETDRANKDLSFDQPVRELKAEQKAALDAPPKFLDSEHELVSLPIRRAMQVVVTGLERDPASATPPAPPGSELASDAGAAAGPADAGAAPAADAAAAAPPTGERAPTSKPDQTTNPDGEGSAQPIKKKHKPKLPQPHVDAP